MTAKTICATSAPPCWEIPSGRTTTAIRASSSIRPATSCHFFHPRGATATMPPAWAEARSATARMAWRYHGERLPHALHLRRGRRQHAGRLADHLRGSRAATTRRPSGRSAFRATIRNNIFHAPRKQAPAHAAAAADREHRDSQAGGPTPRAASFRYPDAAQHRPLQRTRRLHALPLVRGFRLRGQCQVRHAQYRHPKGAGDRQLRTAQPTASPERSSPATGAAPPAWPISMPTDVCRNRPPTS